MNDLRVVMLKSRNKDNQHLDNFRERTKSYLSRRTDEELRDDFESFKNKGQDGEFSRLYVSINPRDNELVKKALLVDLIQHDRDMAKVDTKIVGLAARKECALSEKWLFDYDDDLDKVNEFVEDVRHYAMLPNKKGVTPPNIDVEVNPTPNGYAVIVDRGFDTRELLKKWDKVELKRDELLCLYWGKK